MFINRNSKRNLLICATIITSAVASNLSQAQVTAAENIIWARQLGTTNTDKWGEVAADFKDRIVVGGYTGGSIENINQGEFDMLLAKYSPAGELRWTRQLGTTGSEVISALTVDYANRIIVCGYTTGSLAAHHKGDLDGIVAKFSPSGKLLWIKQYALSTPAWDYPAGVAVDAANNIFVVGYTEGSLARASFGYRDYFLAKFSPEGRLLWRRQYGGPDLDAAYSVASDALGNIFISGFTRNSLDGVNQGASDAFVAKYSNDGDRLWIRQFGTSETEGVSGLATDSNGNVAIGGRTSGSLGGAHRGKTDAFVAKLSGDGALLWVRQLASRAFERLYDIAVDPKDNILAVGHTDGILGSNEAAPPDRSDDLYSAEDAFIAKYNAAGDLLWIDQFGSSQLEGGFGVAADSDSNVLAVGFTGGDLAGTNQGKDDAFLVKLAP